MVNLKSSLVYASKHGCVEKCAQLLAAKIPDGVQIHNLTTQKNVLIADYEIVIIGGSIHVGKIQKEVNDFCHKNKQQLLTKKLGLFLCCANLEHFAAQLKAAYPQELLQHAVAVGHFGYAYYFDKMNFIEKAVIRKIAGSGETIEEIWPEKIKRFVDALYA